MTNSSKLSLLKGTIPSNLSLSKVTLSTYINLFAIKKTAPHHGTPPLEFNAQIDFTYYLYNRDRAVITTSNCLAFSKYHELVPHEKYPLDN